MVGIDANEDIICIVLTERGRSQSLGRKQVWGGGGIVQSSVTTFTLNKLTF